MTDQQLQKMSEEYARAVITGGKMPATPYERGMVRMYAGAFECGYRMGILDERTRRNKRLRKRYKGGKASDTQYGARDRAILGEDPSL